MDTAAALAEPLRSRGDGSIDHPGGTQYGHLGRVQHRLAGLGARPALQLSGRAHAVYGTDGFDVRLLEFDVAAHAPGFPYRHGAYFRRLTTGWEPLLSPAVAADARRVLG